jgi:glycosyltransferase involved in cell wall biosynthesis
MSRVELNGIVTEAVTGDQIMVRAGDIARLSGYFSYVLLHIKNVQDLSFKTQVVHLRDIPDVAGGCNTDIENPFRKNLLECRGNKVSNGINAHVVRINKATSHAHYHPYIGSGRSQVEMYIMLDPAELGIEGIAATGTVDIYLPTFEGPAPHYIRNSVETTPGTFVILPAGIGHQADKVYALVLALLPKGASEEMSLVNSILDGGSIKKVIHVSYQDPDHIAGGQGVSVFNIADAQIKAGLRPIWLSPCVEDELEGEYSYLDGRLTVIKLRIAQEVVQTLFANNEQTQRYREQFGEKFVRYIHEHYRPDECFVHLHGFLEEPRRARELRKRGYNVTSTFHMFLSPRIEAMNVSEPFLSRIKELEKEAILANNKIIVNSNAMKQELLTLCPGYLGDLYVIPNGVGEEYFTPTGFSKDAAPLVTAYGRISPEKGFDMFVEAARLVTDKRKAERRSVVNFLLFGMTNDSIPARKQYKEKIEQLARGYDNILLKMSPSGIPQEEKLSVVGRSFIGIVPSLYEPFGLVLVEYMAQGVPLIASLTHGSRDILDMQSTGIKCMSVP